MDPGYFNIDREQNPRERANFFSKICFWYTRPIFEKGRKGQLSISDVYRCSPGHRAAPRGDVMSEKWREEINKQGNLNNINTNCTSRGLIHFSRHTSTAGGDSHGSIFIAAMGVVGFMAINATLMHPMLLLLLDLSMKIRVACCSLIYRKLLRLDLTAGGKASEGLAGHVVNLLTTDAQRFDMASIFMMDLVRTPIESIIIVYLMYRQIGVSSIIGVAFLLMFIPLQGYLGKISSRFRRQTAVRTDNRIRLMNEVIQSIEAIKMFAWENAFAGIIGQARNIIAFISFDNDLTAAKVFVIFSYYEMLKYTLVDFLPLAITFTLEAYVSVKRMEEFLVLPEVENQDGVDLVNIDKEEVKSNGVFEKIGNGQQAYIKSDSNLDQLKPDYLVSLKDFTVHWKNAEDEQLDRKIPALADINLTIKPETLTVIVGTVGAGKSTLIQAILKELTPSSGVMSVRGNVAYAAQDPWLFDASVRQNILFGQDMDLRRYKQVLKCCQLKTDLEILPHGDKSVVHLYLVVKRARISLARCVYQHADVYLLDDPLAAVDAKVAQAIYEECVRGLLRDRAVVLVTHRANYARHAANVCVMRAGRIVGQGTYQELKTSVPEFDQLIEMGEKTEEVKQKQKMASYENKESMEHSHILRSQRSMSEVSQLSFNVDAETTGPKYEAEGQNKGSVSNSVYVSYISSGGGKFTLLLLLSLFIVAQIFYSSTDIWLKDWVNLEESNSAQNIAIRNSTLAEPVDYESLPLNRWHLSREQCVYVYGSLIAICMFFTWNKLLVFYNTCIRASVNLHDTMFRGVTNAPMWFFHHNPSGRILNRFSKDMGQVDTLLPVALVDCLGFFLEVIGILVVVCLVNWWLLLPTACVAAALMLLRALFLNTSRELKRIEAIARSQSLNHASATVSGLTTIRSTGSQQRTLAQEFDQLQDLHSSAWTLVLCSNRAFGFWMDMLCCVTCYGHVQLLHIFRGW
ncbi:unnamed protein product [Colias eurytheme]|nr:unnamed protein product [Colias eurytheme]